MRHHQQYHAQRFKQPVVGEHDQAKPDGGGRCGTYPPGLALGQIGCGGTWQFWWQAQSRRQAEHGKATQAPQCATDHAVWRAQGIQRSEDQGKADSDHQVTARGRQYALPAIFRRPGFAVVVVIGGHTRGVFMRFNRRRCAFIGFRLENQRRDPEALQQGQQQGGQQAGKACSTGDTLDHRGSTQWQGKAALWRVSWAALCTASMCEKPAK
ncbi:hypothetical protein D3C81_1540400 [compost metagenome]